MFPTPRQSLQLLLNTLVDCQSPKCVAGGKKLAIDVLEKISATHDQAALPYLLAWIHNPDIDIRGTAERAVAQHLPKLNARQIVELEACLRESWMKLNAYGHDFHASSIEGLKLSTLATSGWRREKALIQLLKAGDIDALPFILLRVNDWVPQIRHVAEKWLSIHIASVPLEKIILCIPILAALMDRGQGRSSSFVNTLLERLKSPASATGLLKVLPTVDSRSQRLAFSLLSDGGSLSQPEIQHTLLRHPNPILGVLLLKNLRETNVELPEAVVTHATSSRSALLRRYALYYLSNAQLQRHGPILQKALFDPVQGIRSFAHYHLRKTMSVEELQGLYEKKLEDASSSNAVIAASVIGFHEVGGKWSAQVYEELLGHSSARVRASALRCFSTTHSKTVLPLLRWNLTNTQSPSMAKVALELLQKRPYDISLREIVALLDMREPETLRLRGFALLNKRSKWEKLPILLGLVRDISQAIQDRAFIGLRRWLYSYNHSQIQPSQKQLKDASQELERSKISLGKQLFSEFRHLLDSMAA